MLSLQSLIGKAFIHILHYVFSNCYSSRVDGLLCIVGFRHNLFFWLHPLRHTYSILKSNNSSLIFHKSQYAPFAYIHLNLFYLYISDRVGWTMLLPRNCLGSCGSTSSMPIFSKSLKKSSCTIITTFTLWCVFWINSSTSTLAFLGWYYIWRS